MDIREELKNNILIDMKQHLDSTNLALLERVIIKHTENIKMEYQTQLQTRSDINSYIVQLFYVKKAPKLSDETVKMYISTLKKFSDVINKPFTLIDTTDIEIYLLKKFEKGNSGVSLNNELLCLSSMFEFMRKNGIIDKNPCESVERYPVESKTIEHLNSVEMDELRRACKTDKQRAILEFLRSTALRRGEVASIKMKDVDLENNKITIYGKKNRKYRIVYIDALCKKYLKIYLDTREKLEPNDALFLSKIKDKPMTAHGIYDAMRTISKNANLNRDVYPHLLRKTTATNICRRGGTEDDAGAYLGHTPKTVTGRYYTYKGEEYIKDIFSHYVEEI